MDTLQSQIHPLLLKGKTLDCKQAQRKAMENSFALAQYVAPATSLPLPVNSGC